jgi:pyruvate/2-oxoglutarate dehydrogenase complex dihydrolipoamide acyltransferase (E2) component
MEIETEKATMKERVSKPGVISEVYVKEGDTIPNGWPLYRIEF